MKLYRAAKELEGKVYTHPVSQQLVVFTDYHGDVSDPTMTWRSITGDKRGRVLVSTVLKGDGRWIKYEGQKGSPLLPYSHRS